ncbi:hypothetical protein ACOI1C_19950 [Bacillus sp. DJP31]|uniref:hypothetical protein n=1 Tax=Bacillus sp. DJP31 TaxID=3409789 RepID=UPI003BB7E145
MEIEDIRHSLVEEGLTIQPIVSFDYVVDHGEQGLVHLQLKMKNISAVDLKDFSFIAMFPVEKGTNETESVLENVGEPITFKKGETLVVEKGVKLKDYSAVQHIDELFSSMKIRYYWGDNGQFRRKDIIVSGI